MKRHPALAELSRDHHQALVVALGLQRADEATAARARLAFLDYWNGAGAEHFCAEEETLLPVLLRHTEPGPPIVAQVLEDHARIRDLAREVAAAATPVSTLHRLGAELHGHVRREERELFVLIEQTVPDRELRRVAALLGG